MNRLDATELVVIGNHGLEHVVAGEHVEHEAGVEAAETIEAAIADIRTRLERDALLEGVIFENKRLSASIHYRMAPNPRQVGSILAPLARHAASEHGLRMSEGKNIVELRPLAEVTKGTAIRQLWADGTFGSMVFLGDDLTDVDGFIALQDLRATGNVATLAVGVLGADSHDRVAETADVAVSGVTGVSDLLERLVTSLKASPNE
jgi:trehalose 6-phosphate phosphatase